MIDSDKISKDSSSPGEVFSKILILYFNLMRFLISMIAIASNLELESMGKDIETKLIEVIQKSK